MGPIYLQGSGHRYYLWIGKDAFDGAVCLRLTYSRRMDKVLWFLGECWKDLGRPEQVQIDNARELTGWGPAARTLWRVIRLCLRFGVSPVFIPAGEPQCNGSVCASAMRWYFCANHGALAFFVKLRDHNLLWPANRPPD